MERVELIIFRLRVRVLAWTRH